MEYIIVLIALVVGNKIYNKLTKDIWTGIWKHSDGSEITVRYHYSWDSPSYVMIDGIKHMVNGRFIQFGDHIVENHHGTIIMDNYKIVKTNKKIDIWTGTWLGQCGQKYQMKYKPTESSWCHDIVEVNGQDYYIYSDAIYVNGVRWRNDVGKIDIGGEELWLETDTF